MKVFVSSGHKLKILHWQKSGFAFANTHDQPLQLLHSCGIGKLPGVASVAQTKWLDGPQPPTEMTTTSIASDIKCVWLCMFMP
jgi:hypothetical protein